jgi:hypothetical protein
LLQIKLKSKFKTGPKNSIDDHNEPSDLEWRKKKEWDQLNGDLNSLLGGCKYNPFEDNNFWDDLQKEDGVNVIVSKALVDGLPTANRTDFEELIARIKIQKEMGSSGARPRYGMDMGGSEGSPAVLNDLMKYMAMGEWGAAANVMLEYTTRVGMKKY